MNHFAAGILALAVASSAADAQSPPVPGAAPMGAELTANERGEYAAALYGDPAPMRILPTGRAECSDSSPLDGSRIVTICRGKGDVEGRAWRLLVIDAETRQILQVGEARVGSSDWAVRVYRAPQQPPLVVISNGKDFAAAGITIYRAMGAGLRLSGHVPVAIGTAAQSAFRALDVWIGPKTSSIEITATSTLRRPNGERWLYPARSFRIEESAAGMKMLPGSMPASPSVAF